MEEEFLHDGIVDVASAVAVGVNGLNITRCEINNDKIELAINSPFKWQRKPVIVFRNLKSLAGHTLAINGVPLGTYQGSNLEKGIPVPLAEKK
jgi:hypothetical protein